MSLQNEFKQLCTYAALQARYDLSSCVRDMEITREAEIARMVLGVARVQMHVSLVVSRVVESLPASPLRDVVSVLTHPLVRFRVEAAGHDTCELTGMPTDCVAIAAGVDNSAETRIFRVSRHVLLPLMRCYAFSHIVEKLTQHAHAREDPHAYDVWRDDERQLLLLLP